MSGDIDEAVAVRPYDPGWPQRFARERVRLADGLGSLARAIEHIGSTAVPGLDAKPVVDVLVGVDGPLDGHPALAAVAALGYESFGEAGVPGRRYFRRRAPGDDVNVHVVAHGGEVWADNLLLRDHLRAHPEEARAYAEARRRAAAAAPESLLRYSDLKADVVRALVARARAERGPG